MTDTVPANGQHPDQPPASSPIDAMQAEVGQEQNAGVPPAGGVAGAPPAGPPALTTTTHPHPYPWPAPPAGVQAYGPGGFPAGPPVPLPAPASGPPADPPPVPVAAFAGPPSPAQVAAWQAPVPAAPAPPAPPALPPAGWYPNPAAPDTQRYWDGGGWVGPALPVGVPAPPSGTAPAEAASEYPPGCVEVSLGDPNHPAGDEPVLVHVLPSDRWPTSATTALNAGDFDKWAEICLAGDDIDLWYGLHDEDGPTIGEAADMLEEYGRKSGQDAGKSRRQRRLSMRGRRN